MMLWIIIESLLTLPLVYAIIATIIEFRFGKLKCCAVIGLAVLSTIVMDYGLHIYGVDNEYLYSFAWITTCVPSFLCLLYLTKDRGGSFMFAYLTMCVLASIATSLSYILAYLLPWKYVFIPCLMHAAVLAGILLACRYLFRAKLFDAVRAQGNRWVLYCIMPVLCIVIWVMYTSSSAQLLDIENKVRIPYAGYIYPQDIPFLIVLLVVFFYTVALILIIISRTYQASTERRDKLALDYEIRIMHERLTNLEEKDENLRILRHDMRHHLSTLSGLMDNKAHLQEAQEYLRQLDNTLMQTKQDRFCSNAVINAILSSYSQKALREGLVFSIEVQIPETLPVDIMDIGAVLSNALENALNACLRQDAEEKRFMSIKFIQHKKQFVLDISNSYSGTVVFDFNGRPVSQKENHGTGSQSIYAFVRKYEATGDYSAQNGIFRLCIMFSENDQKQPKMIT